MTAPPPPPRVADWLLRRFLNDTPADLSIVGDLREEFRARSASRLGWARTRYWRDVVTVIAHGLRARAGRRRWAPTSPISAKGDPTMSRLVHELRHAIRNLRRTPGFFAVAAGTLAIGIGANSAIFSVVNGVLLQPLPFANAERLVNIAHTAPGLGYDQIPVSPAIYFQYRAESDAFEDMAAYTAFQGTVTGDGDPERVRVMRASASLFTTYGIRPLVGRHFLEVDDLPGGPDMVMISDRLWRDRFGADPNVVGRTVSLNDVAREIVGVIPRWDWYDDPPDMWVPLGIDPDQANPGNFSFESVGRLRPGETSERAEAQLAQLANRLREVYADQANFVAFLDAGQLAPVVEPLQEEIVGSLARPLWILLGTVGFVLLIACANVANLSLVRAETRRREMAVRTALGARRGTLVRQFFLESAVLATAGAVIGLVLTVVGVPALLRAAPANMPRFETIGVNGAVVGYTVLITALATLLFGVMPAVSQTGSGVLAGLRQGDRGNSGGRDRHLVRNGLVVTQTALALILLVGSGLLIRSFGQIRGTDLGFVADDVLTFQIALPNQRYATPTETASFHDRLRARLAALPGVESVGAARNIPLLGEASGSAHVVEDHPVEAGELPPMMMFTFVTPEYFETMGIPVRGGRDFTPADHQTNLGNAIISASLARKYWPDVDPVGRRLRRAGGTAWYTVVGVVGDVRHRGVREEPSEMIYLPVVGPARDQDWNALQLHYTVRGGNPAALGPAVRAAVRELDPNLPIIAMRTMADVVAASERRLSFTMLTLGIAAMLALALGAIGLYGVLSYVVSQRTREIGLRIALGAPPLRVRNMVVAQGFRVAGLGLAVGVAGSMALTRLLEGILYGVTPLDPLTFAGTTALLAAVGGVASWVPARRASGVDPMESLRSD